MESVTIIPFRQDLAFYFKSLNVAWLEKYFYVEPIDELMLSNPEEQIIDKGGQIYFVLVGTEVVGTAALLKTADHEFELGKMAVDEKSRGNKVGNQLLVHCINESKRLGAKKIHLYSNTILKPAIHLYRKYGFVEVPILEVEYERSDIKMEKILA